MRPNMLKQLKKGMSIMVMASVLLGTQGMPAGAASSASVQKVTLLKPDTSVLVLKKNSKYQLKAKVTVKGSVSKKVTYKSSNAGIVKVDKNGKLTAIKKGTAKITIKSVADSSKKVVLTVKTGTPVTSVKFDKAKLNGKEGETAILKASVMPKDATKKTVIFTSSNSKVVKVSKNGKATFVKAGTAKITAKAQDGSGKKASCNVTVTKKEPSGTQVKEGSLQLCKTDHDGDAATPDRMQLCDANGNPVQLKGMSTFGLQWDDGSWVLNEKAFDALAYDWQCDIIRLAMYVQEDGYADHPQEMLDRVEKGIKLATDRSMYVLVDWHILSPGDPNNETYLNAGLELAKEGGPFSEIAKKHPEYNGPQLFFSYLSEKYGSQGNVLFELANEPNGLGTEENASEVWNSQLKPYYEKVIAAIREYDADTEDNIVICGTDNWSQFVNAPVSSPVNDPSVMYTVHFYAGSHDAGYDKEEQYWLRAKIDEALDNGLAVFCTEWGTSEANGDGGPYIDFSERWLQYFEENKISWCSWSMAKKDEISAACTKATLAEPEDINGDGIPEWDSKTLSISGNYVRAKIRGEEAPVYTESEIAIDFEKGIGQCIVDADSPNQGIMLEQEVISDAALKISNVSGDDIWNNRVRLSDLGTTYGIYQNLAFDFMVKKEDVPNINVHIKPVIQSEATGWWGDGIAEKSFGKDDFAPLNDEYSICHVVFPLEALKAAPADSLGHIMLLLAAGECKNIYIDNVRFFSSSNGDIKYKAKLPDNPGEYVSMPFTFESKTREGWVTDGTSKLDYEDFTTGIAETTALKFPVAFNGTNNEWEDGARISSPHFPEGQMTLEKSKKVKSIDLDMYLEPEHATAGNLEIVALPIPNGAGYWYEAGKCPVDPIKGGETITNSEGTTLLKYHVSIPFSADGKYPYSDEVPIRNLILVVKSDSSNYTGYVYLDNIALTEAE